MSESAALVVHRDGPVAIEPLRLDADGARRLHEAFLSGRGANTRRAYAQAGADFATFLSRRLGREFGAVEALDELLHLEAGPANLVALEYREDLRSRALAPGTMSVRLSALRAAVRLARSLGMVTWTLEVESPKVERYRDTAGPGLDGVQAIADAARRRDDAIGARDRALLALLFLQGLRRGEAVSLDVEHVELERRRISVLGKGRLEREWVEIAPEAVAALRAWIAVHPDIQAGHTTSGVPLLVGWSATTGAPGGRLTGRGVAKIVARYGRAARIGHVRAHGLRHAAATALLDAGMSWAEVAGFTRHKDPSTLRHYDDNRAKRGAKAARRLGKLVRI